MDVSILRLVMPTKFASSSNSIDFPVKSRTSFQLFKSNLEINLNILSTNNPFLTLMMDNFNAKSSN